MVSGFSNAGKQLGPELARTHCNNLPEASAQECFHQNLANARQAPRFLQAAWRICDLMKAAPRFELERRQRKLPKTAINTGFTISKIANLGRLPYRSPTATDKMTLA